MRLGLLARADQRGIGHVTREFAEHMSPDRTLVIRVPQSEAEGFPTHPEWYPGAEVVDWRGRLPEKETRRFLAGLDVVYVVETAYDDRFWSWCSDAHVRPVLHAMPEFYRWGRMLPAPDVRVWAPTSWRLGELPPSTTVVPVPVAVERFAPHKSRGAGEPLRVLHVGGKPASGDRNGTGLFLRALEHVTVTVVATVTSFGGLGSDFDVRRLPEHVALRYPTATVDYPALYADRDVLVMPRRYGGLCLPTQEAMAAGLAVVMPDVEPNTDWPVLTYPAVPQGHFRTPAGVISTYDSHPKDIAAMIDSLAGFPDLNAAQEDSRDWALHHSWDALRDTYADALSR